MNVIVILHKDVYNIPAYHVIKEMLKRGYHIAFFAFFFDHIHLRMFDDFNVQIRNIKELKHINMDDFDFIFSSVNIDAIPDIMQIKKYIFVFSTTFMNECGSYGDYTFTQRDLTNCLSDYDYSVEKNNRRKCSPGKALGNPKFDIEENCQAEFVDKKQILFVEASHFPYGKVAKMEEAGMVLEICRKCLQYQIIIKPRFFPDEKNVTHRNGTHLYQCIDELTGGNIPDNLVLLHEHIDLEKLVRQSGMIVLTEMTTSYLDIGAYNKRGIIASNFPSENSFTHNVNRVRRFRSIQARSGMCVDYRNVINYLPHGIPCKEEHIAEMGIDKKSVSQNMVNEMEKIYMNYLLFDKYPSPDSSSETITMDEVVSYRYLKRLYTVFDPIKENIDELDFRKAEKYIENLWGSREVLTDKTYEKHLDHLLNIVWDIMINSKEVLMKDALSQSYYLKLLYETGAMQAENIEQYEEQAKAMYFCLMGKYKAIDQKQYEEAIKYFRKYFCIIQKNDFEKTLADTPYYKESATYWTGVCYYELFEFEEAKKYFLKCQELTENNHKKAAQYIEKINR